MEKRIKHLQQSMAQEALNAYYITSPYNLRYVTGFTETNGVALILEDEAYFITDFRYRQQAELQTEGMEVIIAGGSASTTSPIETMAKLMEEKGVTRLGYEEEHLTVAQYDELESSWKVELVPSSGMIEALRETKDEQEIALLRRACEITDQAFEHILNFIHPGRTEIEIANELDFTMRKLGASGVSFDTIIASGWRSAMPHGVASNKEVKDGELITLDFGCLYEGYRSDMTRTIAIGAPDSQLRDIYQIVKEANELVYHSIKPGMIGRDVDKIARDFIKDKGYGEAFGHGLGHSIGLEIHEDPYLVQSSHRTLRVNQVVTDEPGIYIEGLGGVRIEDDLLITEDGAEALTNSSRVLITL